MYNNNKLIIISGYPKSGNTWLTRLTSELTGSPSKGFLGDDKSNEFSVVNSDLKSEYSVYKSHYTYHELTEYYEGALVICIVRDVRDVAISASHNFKKRFNIAPDNLLGDFIQMNNVTYSIYDKLFGNKRRINQMIQVLKFGRYDMRWCRLPWDLHISSFLGSSALIVKYEDLLSQPMQECKRILDHLSITRSEDYIKKAYYNQSFNVTKQQAEQVGNMKHQQFLRKGKSGEWINVLTMHQKNILYKYFKETLHALQYI